MVVFLLTFSYLSTAKAQDTFGPICDDVTVTCVPTDTPGAGVNPSPTPESAPSETPTITPTSTPTPPVPTELPRAGTSSPVNQIVIIAMSLIVAGAFAQIALIPNKK